MSYSLFFAILFMGCIRLHLSNIGDFYYRVNENFKDTPKSFVDVG